MKIPPRTYEEDKMTKKRHAFIVIATIQEDEMGTEWMDVDVFDGDDPDPVPLPIAEGTSPALASNALADTIWKAFSALELPSKKEEKA
jgi:hypothetical protein